MKTLTLWCGVALASLSLAACGDKPSAVATHDTGAPPSASGGVSTAETGSSRSTDPRDLPVPKVDGKPMWAANRRHTAEENAQYQFTKNGGDFGARSESDYITKVHAFIDRPPRDVETLERPNGDRLMYDAKGNVFVVVARNGAPRTMFKPRDGAAYWEQQKERESHRPKGGQEGGGLDQS